MQAETEADNQVAIDAGEAMELFTNLLRDQQREIAELRDLLVRQQAVLRLLSSAIADHQRALEAKQPAQKPARPAMVN